MVDDGLGDSAVDELEFDLNHLREARPDLAPENLIQTGSLILIDRYRPTNLDHCLLRKLLKNTFHDLLKPLKMAVVTRMSFPTQPISPPSRNKVDEAIEILNRITLSTADLDLDPLLLKNLKQNISLVIFLKEAVTTVF